MQMKHESYLIPRMQEDGAPRVLEPGTRVVAPADCERIEQHHKQLVEKFLDVQQERDVLALEIAALAELLTRALKSLAGR